MGRTPLFLLVAIGSLLTGAIDFLSPHAWPLVVLALASGALVGYGVPAGCWQKTALFGVGVAAAVVVGMALRLHPARPHFIFVDAARASGLATVAAATVTWARTRARLRVSDPHNEL